MKNLLIAAIILASIVSCKKEYTSQSIDASRSSNSLQKEEEYLKNVKAI